MDDGGEKETTVTHQLGQQPLRRDLFLYLQCFSVIESYWTSWLVLQIHAWETIPLRDSLRLSPT